VTADFAFPDGPLRLIMPTERERSTGPGPVSADRRRTDHLDTDLVPVGYDDAAMKTPL
jgi:hypothetical protein